MENKEEGKGIGRGVSDSPHASEEVSDPSSNHHHHLFLFLITTTHIEVE